MDLYEIIPLIIVFPIAAIIIVNVIKKHMKYKKYKELIDQYTMMLLPMAGNLKEANKMANDMFEVAMQKSKQEGTIRFPTNLGDIILGDADTNDPEIKSFVAHVRNNLPIKKEEGVTDNDIKWFFNLDDIERRMMEEFSNMSRMALYMKTLDENSHLSHDEASNLAAAKVRKYHPYYGNPKDESYSKKTGTGINDRPLPYELRDRINEYISSIVDEDSFNKEIQESSTFNALVRKKIREGRL